jgi:hypothetical protein
MYNECAFIFHSYLKPTTRCGKCQKNTKNSYDIDDDDDEDVDNSNGKRKKNISTRHKRMEKKLSICNLAKES